jgi:hypothetical protein
MASAESIYGLRKEVNVSRDEYVRVIERAADDIVFLILFDTVLAVSDKLISYAVENVSKTKVKVEEEDGKIISVTIIGKNLYDLSVIFLDGGIGVIEFPRKISLPPFSYQKEEKKQNRLC